MQSSSVVKPEQVISHKKEAILKYRSLYEKPVEK